MNMACSTQRSRSKQEHGKEHINKKI